MPSRSRMRRARARRYGSPVHRSTTGVSAVNRSPSYRNRVPAGVSDVIDSTWRTVAVASGTAEVKFPIGVSRLNVPASTHCISSVDVAVFVIDAVRYGVLGVAATRASTSASPMPPSQITRPPEVMMPESPGIPACTRRGSRYRVNSSSRCSRSAASWALVFANGIEMMIPTTAAVARRKRIYRSAIY